MKREISAVSTGRLFLITLVLVAGSAHAQSAGSGLLEGLTPANNAGVDVGGPSPAQAKAVDGVPGLRYGGLSVTMGRSSRGSSMEPGYVILKSGERLEGEVSVKIRMDRGDNDWRLHELEYRPAKGEKKQKFEASFVHDFGLNFTMNDYKAESRDPASSFHETVVRMNDGSEVRGLGALVGSTIGGYTGLYYAQSATANVEGIQPARILEITQVRNGAAFAFISYNGGLQSATRGNNFLLFKNPKPTTRDDSWKAGFANFGARAASTMIANAAAAKAVQQENVRLQKRVDSGDNLNSVVQDARFTAQRLEQQQRNAAEIVNNVDLGLMKTEYIIRNIRTGYEVFVHDGNLEAEITPLLAACSVTARMSKGERKDLTKFKNIESLFQTLDRCF